MTDLIIKYIARVNVDTGQVESVEFVPGGTLPEEGISSGQEIVHIPSAGWESYDSIQIHEQFYRKEGAWVHRGARPNKYYEWSVETEQWTLDSERLSQDLRIERTRRLYQCDWTQAPDAPITPEDVELWKLYRQSLRDFPSSCTNINSLEGLVWPTPPE